MAILVERLHHRQVRPDADEQYRLAGQLAVENLLQGSLEARIGADEVRHLVEDHDAGPVLRKAAREQPERRVPCRWSLADEETSVGDVGFEYGLGKQCQVRLDGGLSRRGEEDRWHARPIDEFLNQPGLADPPSPADEDRPAGTTRPPTADRPAEQPVEQLKLMLTSDELIHVRPQSNQF